MTAATTRRFPIVPITQTSPRRATSTISAAAIEYSGSVKGSPVVFILHKSKLSRITFSNLLTVHHEMTLEDHGITMKKAALISEDMRGVSEGKQYDDANCIQVYNRCIASHAMIYEDLFQKISFDIRIPSSPLHQFTRQLLKALFPKHTVANCFPRFFVLRFPSPKPRPYYLDATVHADIFLFNYAL